MNPARSLRSGGQPASRTASSRRRAAIPPPAAVLDASAILALLLQEPGAQVVEKMLPSSACSAVNWSEVVQKGHQAGADLSDLQAELTALGMSVIDFTAAHAERAAALYEAGRPLGLSLADRACLALAVVLGVPALTADTNWTRLNDGPEVWPIR